MSKKMKILLSLFLWIITLSRIWSQEIPYIQHLSSIDGKVKTYYADGCKSKAIYLQELIEDAVSFFEQKLTDTIHLKLLVVDKKDWKYFASSSYPLPQFNRNYGYIIMANENLFKIKLPSDKTLFGSKEAYFWDFIAVHELGHYFSKKYNASSNTHWLSEFFADYFMIGYMVETIPGFQYPDLASTLWKVLPFKHKTLEDFENTERMHPANYSVYQSKFQELAYAIFKVQEWSFVDDYISTYSSLNDSLKMLENRSIEKGYFYEYSISYMESNEPEIFASWLPSMSKSFHYYLIALVLIILIIGMKINDKSYQLLKYQGFKLKKINRVLGVSSVKILFRLKKIKDRKIRRKLYVAILSRAVMCFSFICLLLWISIFFIIAI